MFDNYAKVTLSQVVVKGGGEQYSLAYRNSDDEVYSVKLKREDFYGFLSVAENIVTKEITTPSCNILIININ